MIIGQSAVRQFFRTRAERRRHGRQRGAVAIEAAVLTPLLLLMTFGIIEFGMLFKDWLAVTSSVRAGARIASAEPRISTFAQDAADQVAREGAALDMGNVEALWVYEADVNGFPVGGSGTFNSCSSCVKFAWSSATKKFVQTSATWTSSQQNACQGDAGHDAVGVYLQIEHEGVTGLIFDEITIKEHTVMSLEPMPTSNTCK